MTIKEILVLHHSHLDVGFTHSQPILWEMQREYLDQALDFLDATAGFRGPSLPRWTCEVTAPLMRWLETASPAQVERFGRGLAEGRIGISAMEYNTTPLCSAAQLARQLYPVRSLRERFGATINTLNQHDVDGVPWPMVELMAGSGIELLILAINLHLGGAPSPRPGIFRWQGATGREVLVMNGNHYTMFDQILYAWEESHERMAQGLAEYEEVLARIDYPYDFLYLTTSNSPAAWDNSPPNLATARLIQGWNESGRQPVIRYVTPGMLLERLRQIPPEQIPVRRGDWTDYWNFGCASTAVETRLNQNAKAALFSAELLAASQGRPQNNRAALASVSRRAWAALNLYDEHTWGYHNTDPDHPQMHTQTLLKKACAHEARELADYLLVNALEALAGNPLQSGRPEGVLLANPSGAHQAVYVPIPEGWRREGKRLRSNRFEYGSMHPAKSAPLYGPVDLPPYAWKVIPLADLPPVAADSRLQVGEGAIETPFYRLAFNPQTGRITSLFDRLGQWEVLAPESGFTLFEFVRERTSALVDDRREAYYNRDLIREKFNLSCWQTGWKAVREQASRPLACRVEAGPESATLVLEFEAPGVSRLEQRFTFHAGSPLIDLDVILDKLDFRRPEGIYFAIPLNLPEGWECAFDTAGMPVRLDRDQLPGACRDWFTAESYAALFDQTHGVTLYCPDAPMVQAGGFNFGRKQDAIPRQAGPLLLAWPMNNYWNTNFPLAQPGRAHFHYVLQAHGPFDPFQAARQAQSIRSGVLVHPVCVEETGPDGLKPAVTARQGQLLELAGQNLLVAQVKTAEDGHGLIFRLQNLGAEPSAAALKPGWFSARAAWRCTPLEDDLAPLGVAGGAVQINIQPFDLVTIRVIE